ncbi:hypothetical protein ACJ73_09920 [Blastomyces percursus]|uniref:Hydrophobin n=1 Tax=Blastomyces percursus TaxID=1658174 RepID=A0A1J9Q4Q5_9EURO|nr:hypothetical protein ACJ73_09920 [Blastomyces percursus]
MPSLSSLLLYLNLPNLRLLLLLFTTLYTTPASAASCISTNGINVCCPGSIFGGLTSDGNGKATAHGICCIDPSTIRRKSIGSDDSNIMVVVNEEIHRRQAGRVDIGPTACSDNQILIPLSATDYSQQVSSVMASISSGGSGGGDSSSINIGTAAPTGAATNTAGESTSVAETTTTPVSTGGMPAATGERSYVVAIGGVVAAAVLIAGGL